MVSGCERPRCFLACRTMFRHSFRHPFSSQTPQHRAFKPKLSVFATTSCRAASVATSFGTLLTAILFNPEHMYEYSYVCSTNSCFYFSYLHSFRPILAIHDSTNHLTHTHPHSTHPHHTSTCFHTPTPISVPRHHSFNPLTVFMPTAFDDVRA